MKLVDFLIIVVIVTINKRFLYGLLVTSRGRYSIALPLEVDISIFDTCQVGLPLQLKLVIC